MNVNISIPGDGSALKGVVPVTIDARPTKNIRRVELRVDGTVLGQASGVPAEFLWDTTTGADGQYTLRADVIYKERTSTGMLTVRVVNATAPPPPPPPPPSNDYPASWLAGPSDDAIFKSVIPAPGKGAIVGIWDSGHPGITRITQRESEVGRRFDIGAGSYYGALPNSDGKITLIKQGGRFPLCDAGHFGAASASEILNGSKDAWIRSWVKAASAIGGPVLVRYFHEYAGPWMAVHWYDNARTRRCTASEWKAMCQRPIDIARSEGITNLIWIWCPTVYNDRPAVYGSYPGDSYVDVVGDDGYGYADQQWMGYVFDWATHAMVFNYAVVFYPAGDPRREELKAPHEAFPHKPFAVMETGRHPHSTDTGRKRQWLVEIPAHAKTYLPRLVAHMYSDYGKEADPNGGDWTLDIPASALDGYRSMVNDPYFKTRSVPLSAAQEEIGEEIAGHASPASLHLEEHSHLRPHVDKAGSEKEV